PDVAGNRPHARPLREKRERLNRLVSFNATGREPFSGSVGTCRTADLTAVALHLAVPVSAEFLEGFAVTFRAFHVRLAFPAEQADNGFASAFAVCSAIADWAWR